MVAGGVSLTLSACSFSLPSIVPSPEDATGSIGRADGSPLSPEIGGEDWRRARGALAIALDPQGNGTAVAWDNSDTQLKGSITPVGQPYVKADEVCRAFLASIVRPSHETSLQGTACKLGGGEWAIREIRPFKRPG